MRALTMTERIIMASRHMRVRQIVGVAIVTILVVPFLLTWAAILLLILMRTIEAIRG